jgi:hypothetical protein
MLPLPLDVLRLVYAFDPTYRHVYNLCLLELEVLFGEHRFPRRVLRRMRVERVLWAWAGDVPLVLSWTRARESLGSRHSDMPGCGCACQVFAQPAYLSHGRCGPRRGPSPSPRPLGRRSDMTVEMSVGYVRWVGVWARAWEGRAARGAEWDGMKWKERGAEWADGRLERACRKRLSYFFGPAPSTAVGCWS